MSTPSSPGVPGEAVGKLAQRLYEEHGVERPAALTWDATQESVREMYRQDARAHLQVVGPILAQQIHREVAERLKELAHGDELDSGKDNWTARERWREAGSDASVFDDDTDPDYIDLISDAAAKRAVSGLLTRFAESDPASPYEGEGAEVRKEVSEAVREGWDELGLWLFRTDARWDGWQQFDSPAHLADTAEDGRFEVQRFVPAEPQPPSQEGEPEPDLSGVCCSVCGREAEAREEIGSICAFVHPNRIETCRGVLTILPSEAQSVPSSLGAPSVCEKHGASDCEECFGAALAGSSLGGRGLDAVLKHFESEMRSAGELADAAAPGSGARARHVAEESTYRYVLKQIREAQPPEQDRLAEELTMIALALKNQGIEDCTPEKGVEELLTLLHAAERAHGEVGRLEDALDRSERRLAQFEAALLGEEAKGAAYDAGSGASVYTELDDEYLRLITDAAVEAAHAKAKEATNA